MRERGFPRDGDGAREDLEAIGAEGGEGGGPRGEDGSRGPGAGSPSGREARGAGAAPEEGADRPREGAADPGDAPGAPVESGPGGSAEPVEEGDDARAAVLEELGSMDTRELLDLKKRLDERDLLVGELLRTRADLDNYQKRVRRERPNWEDHAVRRFVADIIPVVDNFELALASAARESTDAESLRQGIQMIYQLLQKALADNGVEEIAPLGQPFDPEFHEAVAEEDVSDRRTGDVVGVQQNGYVHKGVVVRPARVVVARNVEESRSGRDQGD